MKNNSEPKQENTLTLDGITFRTNGNIVFSDEKDNPYVLAQSPLMDKMDSILENGVQTLLKKLRS